MAEARAEISIAVPPDAVWTVVADFGGLAGWMPGIESCTLDGDVRTLQIFGTEMKETLVRSDGAARVLVYSVGENALGIEDHEVTIGVLDDGGGGSHVTWDVRVTPDAMAGVMQSAYQQALEALRAHVEA